MKQLEAVTLAETRRLAAAGEARTIRERAGLSQTEVAAVCAVSAALVSRWEAGLRRPQGPAALRYGRLLRALQEVQQP